MSQRRQNLTVTARVGVVTLVLFLAIAPTISVARDRLPADGSDEAIVAERLPAETVMAADLRVPQLETSSVLAAALCFAVGFGACLLLVHNLLPSLVHAQCIKILREHLDLVRRESDIRVVILNRESDEPLQKPRRAGSPAAEAAVESSYELQQHLRVDQPAAMAGPANTHSADAPNSMLSQIYEQNLHLRDQLRKQSQSVKQ